MEANEKQILTYLKLYGLPDRLDILLENFARKSDKFHTTKLTYLLTIRYLFDTRV